MSAASPFHRAALDAARQALQRGALDDAQGRCAALLDKAPEDVEALHLSGLVAFRQRRHGAALDFLLRARRLAPDDAQLLTSLGHVQEAVGDAPAALEAFDALLASRPDDFAARLHRGRLLEQLGRGVEALFAYGRAIHDARRHGRWLSDETTAPALRDQVRHAIGTVNRGVGLYYERAYQPVQDRHGPDALRRVRRALAMHLGHEPLVHADPRQQPTFLYIPELPATPYLDLRGERWREALEAETEAITAELRERLPQAEGREAVFHSGELAEENLKGTQASRPAWNGYYFYRHGEARQANRDACPRTAAALDRAPLARIPGHGPEVLFSVFDPGTHLLPHRGVTNSRVVGHLPLIVPPDCALRVGGETHVWRRGEIVVFDDSYEHEAWNRSDAVRVVLIFDLWNPHLTPAERDAISALVVAMGDYRAATAPELDSSL